MQAKRALSSSHITLCAIGFIVQSLIVSREYFQYKTRVSIAISHADSLTPPSLSICAYFTYLLNQSKLNQALDLAPNASAAAVRIAARQLTVRSIFELGPDGTLLDGCWTLESHVL